MVESEHTLQKINMVFHTHWDREWYRTKDDYRFRLGEGVRVILDLLGTGALKHFHLDGQTILLEDLEGCLPASTLRQLAQEVRRGRIDVGPWYVLPDEFLAGPEGVIRNLELGLALSSQWGRSPTCVYLPDTFGHISQMPQIALKWGLNSALIFRGVAPGPTDTLWESPDGTQLPTLVLPLRDGYYQPQLNADLKDESFDPAPVLAHLESLAGDSGALVLFLPGADHTLPPPDLTVRLSTLRRALRRKHPGSDLVDTGFGEAMDQWRDGLLPDRHITGEQRDSQKAFVLGGTLSARAYLKRANQECSDLLTGWVEPLSTFVAPSFHRPEWETSLWKALVSNHPHDSICGCSIDEVHREMLVRFEAVERGAFAYLEHLQAALSPKDNVGFEEMLTVFCPHPLPGRFSVEATVVVPATFDLGDVGIEGKVCEVVERRETDGFHAELQRFPDWNPGWAYKLRFEADFAGVGMQSFRLRRQRPAQGRGTWGGPARQVPTGTLSNSQLRCTVQADGSMKLEDLRTGLALDNLQLLTTSADDGDEYTTAPRPGSQTLRARLVGNPMLGGSSSRRQLRLVWELGQEGERPTRYEMLLELRAQESFLRVSLEGSNQGKDQVVHAWFPLPEQVEGTASDTPFDLTWRPLDRSTAGLEPLFTASSAEAPGELPVWSCVSGGPLRLYVKGTCAYDCVAWDSGRDALRLVLTRSVGQLSKKKLTSRGGGAGPAFDTPDAQCLRSMRFDWALSFAPVAESVAGARMFRLECLAFQGTLRSAASLPFQVLGLLGWNNTVLVLSALRRLADGRLLLRLFNPSKESQSLALKGCLGREADPFGNAVGGGRPGDQYAKADHLVRAGAIFHLELVPHRDGAAGDGVLSTD